MKNKWRSSPNPMKRNRRLVVIILAVFGVLAGTATLSFGTWLDFIPKILSRNDAGAVIDMGLIRAAGIRGNIYDRRFTELASSSLCQAVYAKPFEIDDPTTTAAKLAEILARTQEEILPALKSAGSFVWLKKDLNKSAAEKIARLKLKGIYLHDEVQRVYPKNKTAAHVIGFSQKGQGLDGLEFYYDNLLQGGTIREADLPISRSTGREQVGREGAHLVLTLDLKIQELLERELTRLTEEVRAERGRAIVMSARTGAILALANTPSYDPNVFWKYQENARRNRIISEPLLSPDSAVVPDPEGVSRLTVGELVKLLQIDHHFAVDLPDNLVTEATTEGDHGNLHRTTALQLLATFACTLNGGLEIRPHLLATIHDLKSGKEFRTNYGEKSRIIIPAVQRNKTVENMRGHLRSGPGKSLLLTSQQAISSSLTDQPKPEVSHGKNPKGHDLSLNGDASYQEILLGALPGANPELVLLIEIKQRNFKAGANAQLLAMGRTLIPKMTALAREPSPLPAATSWDFKSREYYKKVRNREITGKDHCSPEQTGKGKMPELTGKSLRKGLQLLQSYDLRIKVNGSGRIVSQKPGPGAEITKGSDCVLELSMAQ